MDYIKNRKNVLQYMLSEMLFKYVNWVVSN